MDQRIPSVYLPGSKSIAARALILSYIYNGSVLLANLPDCDDTAELSAALRHLHEYDDILPSGESPQINEVFNLGSGGTSLRFFLAYVASLEGFDGIVDCSEELRHRPLAPLIDALRLAGADISCLKEEGRTPLHVRGKILDGSNVILHTEVSSQFQSALMMASLMWDTPLESCFMTEVSAPYVKMTRSVMYRFQNLVDIAFETQTPQIFHIEGDWSAAGYFFEFALIMPGCPVRLCGLEDPMESLQGDSACVELFERVGVHADFDDEGNCVIAGDLEQISKIRCSDEVLEFDMRHTPDLVPPLAVGLAMSGIPFRMSGVAHLRHKESDRLSALQQELARIDIPLKVECNDKDEILTFHGGRCVYKSGLDGENKIVFDSHRDHRIAMSLSVASILLPGAEVAGKECVAKSFPDFYRQFNKIITLKL